MNKNRSSIFLIYLLFPLWLALSSSSCDSRETKINNPILSIEDEKAVGNKLAQVSKQMTTDFTLLNSAQYKSVYTYINRVLSSLALTPVVKSSQTFDWEVIIIRDNNVRSAFVAPGGKIFIYTGLLKFIKTESELTGVLAHEIYYTDRTKQYNEKTLSPVATALKTRLLTNGDGTKFILDILEGGFDDRAAMIVSTLRSLTYDDEIVEKADAFSIEAVCPFDWDSQGLSNLLKNIKAANIMNFEWLQTHPPSYPASSSEFLSRINRLQTVAQPCNGLIVEQTRYKKEVLDKLP